MVHEGKIHVRSEIYWNSDWDHKGYYSEALDETFTSKEDKRQKMEKHNVVEAQ